MSFTDGIAEPICVLRRKDQVDVVGHQAVCPDIYLCLARLLAQQVTVHLVIAILKENCLSSVAALRYVVR